MKGISDDDDDTIVLQILHSITIDTAITLSVPFSFLISPGSIIYFQ